jgi:hypothetical protein
MFLLSHLAACAYGGLSLVQGLGTSEFGLGRGFADMGGGAYYESFYVAFMAITGSKELNPVTVAEKVLSIAIVVVGTGMSLTLVGNIAALLSTMDQASAAYRCVLGRFLMGVWGAFRSILGCA